MIVNAVRKRKSDVLLEFGEDSVLLIDPALVKKFGLRPDSEFDLAELLKQNEPFSRKRAASCALDYLEKSSRSVKQLTEHLFSKNLQASVIEETVKELLSRNLLNDRDLASRVTENMISSGKSLRKTKEKLYRAGIGREVIAETASAVDGTAERGNLMEFLKRKNESLRRTPPLLRREKMIRSAVSAGFCASDASGIAEELTADDDPADYEDYYMELGRRRLRALMDKDLTEKELRKRFVSEMRKKGSPMGFIDECLREAEDSESDG